MPRIRPIVFVGSSSEAKNIAQTFCTVLSDTADMMPWWLAPEFHVMENTLDSLIKAADKYDFGLFVFAPDDMIESRGQKEMSTRDNVLFELGLFLGRLGAGRTFAVIQGAQSKIDQIKIPSDLLGIHIPRYTYLDDSGLIASVNNAAVSIREAIQRRWKMDRKLQLARGWHYDNREKLFSMTLSSIRLEQNKERLSDEHFVIIIRKRDEHKDFDNDEKIIRGNVRKFPAFLQGDIILTADCKEYPGGFQEGDVIEAHLLIIPEGFDLKNYSTIHSMLRNGCELLESVGTTMRVSDYRG
jgi:hypothetical protein